MKGNLFEKRSAITDIIREIQSEHGTEDVLTTLYYAVSNAVSDDKDVFKKNLLSVIAESISSVKK